MFDNPFSSRRRRECPDANDLTPILRRLTSRRKSLKAKRRLANDEVTKLLLDAGLRVITQQMQAADHVAEAVGNQESDEARAFFSWLSRPRILAEARAMAHDLGPNEGKFRDRWEFQSDYIEDLLSYCLWRKHWSLDVNEVADTYRRLTSHPDFARAIHEVAYNDLVALSDNPAYKIYLIAAATAAHDPVARRAIADTYKFLQKSRSRLYKATVQARGLKLRNDVSLQELTDILAALADGIGLRVISDPDAGVLDNERRESLLGKAAIALAFAFIDPGDGRSLEEIFRNVTQSPRENG